MKKLYGFIVFFIAFILLVGNVNALNTGCYYLHGTENGPEPVIVPDGYHVDCGTYTFRGTGNNIKSDSNYYHPDDGDLDIGVEIYENFIYITSPHDGETIIQINTGSVDVGKAKSWGKIIPSEIRIDNPGIEGYSTNGFIGCPATVYWYEVNNFTTIGFSGYEFTQNDQPPNMPTSHPTKDINYAYATYVRNPKYDTPSGYYMQDYPLKGAVRIVSNDGDVFGWSKVADDYYSPAFTEEEDPYAQDLKKCEGQDIGTDTPIHDNPTSSKQQKFLKGCTYYYCFKNGHTKKAYQVTLNFWDEISYQELFVTHKMVYYIGTNNSIETNIDNIDQAFSRFEMNDPSTYSYVKDYIIYDGTNLTCPENLYIYDNNSNPAKLFIIDEKSYNNHITAGDSKYINIKAVLDNENVCPQYSYGYDSSVKCPLGPNVTRDLYGVLMIMKILAPLLCIVLSIIEAIKAIAKGDVAADIKVVYKRFLKRMIYAIILFFIPVLVDLFFQMADVWDAHGQCNFNDLTKIVRKF